MNTATDDTIKLIEHFRLGMLQFLYSLNILKLFASPKFHMVI